jgi:hypothetical protein
VPPSARRIVGCKLSSAEPFSRYGPDSELVIVCRIEQPIEGMWPNADQAFVHPRVVPKRA